VTLVIAVLEELDVDSVAGNREKDWAALAAPISDVKGEDMSSTALQALTECGQSVWLDSLSRDLVQSGGLANLIEEQGVTGVTANPSIFEKAIVGGHDYDETIRSLGAEGLPSMEIYDRLAIQDVGAAADLLRPAYDRCHGCDGFASLEVSPDLAHDTDASIEEARRFWRELGRPNVMIKIPATAEGIPAIEELIAEGVNVNITLIFGIEMYKRVMDAYQKGLERRLESGRPIGHVSSVASFFVSRVDTLVDKLLERRAQESRGSDPSLFQALRGKTAVANAKIAYEHFQLVFGAERFKRLEERGGQLQRPLWASTGTKNVDYSDTLYVGPLIGPRTVNTMPLETMRAFEDHGSVDCAAVKHGLAEVHRQIEALERAGISMKATTDELIHEGVEKFCHALHSLLDAIDQRKGALAKV
jgi:transaldolase